MVGTILVSFAVTFLVFLWYNKLDVWDVMYFGKLIITQVNPYVNLFLKSFKVKWFVMMGNHLKRKKGFLR